MYQRSAEQADLLAQALETRAQEERKVFLRLLPSIRPGHILEIGCGNGLILSILRELLPESQLVGLEVSPDMVRAARERNIDGTLLLNCIANNFIAADDSFDTILFCKSFHEIYSFDGADSIKPLLRNCYRMLKPGGSLIVRDCIAAEPREVHFSVNDPMLVEQFERFSREFIPRRIPYVREGLTLRSQVSDVMEFLSKYWENDWETEMRETHFFYTRDDWDSTFAAAGFRDVDIRTEPMPTLYVDSRINFEWKIPDGRLHLVARK